jgi:hypothetical protein
MANCLGTRFQAAGLALVPNSVPLVTNQFMDQVFKHLVFGGGGQQMGHGLVPFAIVCEGHIERKAARQASATTAQSESGIGDFSLANSMSTMTTNAHLPPSPQIAQEKLLGWSIAINIILGPTHVSTLATRECVQCAHPFFGQFSEG